MGYSDHCEAVTAGEGLCQGSTALVMVTRAFRGIRVTQTAVHGRWGTRALLTSDRPPPPWPSFMYVCVYNVYIQELYENLIHTHKPTLGSARPRGL